MRREATVPDGWSLQTLASTALPGRHGFNDGDWIESPYITGTGIRLIQTGNIGVGEFLDKPDSRKFISEHSFRVLGCKWVRPGDLLICRMADPIGRACIVPEHVGDSVTAVDCTIYRPAPGAADSGYMLHRLNSVEHLRVAADTAGGSTRQRISRSNLGNMVVPVPPLVEQRRIAEILDTVDEAIRSTEAVIAKLEQVKRGLLHDLLTRGIDDNGELRDPERHPEQFKDSPLGRIPRDWDVGLLGDHLESKPQNGLYKPSSAYGDDGVRILRIDGFYDGVMRPQSSLKRVRLSKSEVGLYGLNEGDLVINRVNSIDFIGKMAYIPRLSEPAVFESNMMRLRLASTLQPLFATAWLCAPWARRHFFTRAKNAIAQASINQTDVCTTPIVLPPSSEQTEVVRRLREVDERVSLERGEAEKLRLLKAGLMDDLLTGRVRTQPIEGGRRE